MLEAVPNVSEGRDAFSIGAIGRAFASSASLLDVHSDADHHRSVYTLASEPEALVESLVAGAAAAVERIDLESHDGIHPRVGAIDVVPLVPLGDVPMAEAGRAAVAAGKRIGTEIGLPVFLYGELGGGRRPMYFRRGGLDELVRRLDAGELRPDYGPRRVSTHAGVVLVGARSFLVAYNVELASEEVELARDIARGVRESNGGMPGVQAIGLWLPRSRRVQVSMNVLDLDRAPLHEVVERVRAEAATRGVAVSGGELVGLVPARVVEAAAAAGVEVPGVDESRVLERALRLARTL